MQRPSQFLVYLVPGFVRLCCRIKRTAPFHLDLHDGSKAEMVKGVPNIGVVYLCVQNVVNNKSFSNR